MRSLAEILAELDGNNADEKHRLKQEKRCRALESNDIFCGRSGGPYLKDRHTIAMRRPHAVDREEPISGTASGLLNVVLAPIQGFVSLFKPKRKGLDSNAISVANAVRAAATTLGGATGEYDKQTNDDKIKNQNEMSESGSDKHSTSSDDDDDPFVVNSVPMSRRRQREEEKSASLFHHEETRDEETRDKLRRWRQELRLQTALQRWSEQDRRLNDQLQHQQQMQQQEQQNEKWEQVHNSEGGGTFDNRHLTTQQLRREEEMKIIVEMRRLWRKWRNITILLQRQEMDDEEIFENLTTQQKRIRMSEREIQEAELQNLTQRLRHLRERRFEIEDEDEKTLPAQQQQQRPSIQPQQQQQQQQRIFLPDTTFKNQTFPNFDVPYAIQQEIDEEEEMPEL